MEQLEAVHYALQKGILFTGKKKIQGAEILYSNSVDDCYWNYATSISVNGGDVGELLKAVQAFYTGKKRAPALYLTPSSSPRGIEGQLLRAGFSLKYSDSWMTHTEGIRHISDAVKGVAIREASTTKEMQSFIDIFNAVYGSAGTGPYAGVSSGYGRAMLSSFKKKGRSRVIRYYIAYLGRKRVGCAMLVMDKDHAGLYGLGVLPEARGMGIARALMGRRISDARRNGVSTVFLQTESGSINQRIFKRLGFRTEFIGRCFVKR